MGPDSETLQFESSIRNDAWMVRHYAPQRTPAMRLRRAQAIQKLGLTVRYAFNRSEDFERLLVAIVDGLRPTESTPPF